MKEHRYDKYIEEKLNGTRLDVVLSFSVPEVSRSFVQKLIDGGAVSVDEKVCLSKKEKVKTGQIVSVIVPEQEEHEIKAEDIPLDKIYEHS